MRVVIQDNYDKMCKWAANYIAAKIKNHKEERPFVLGLPTGSSPIGVYKELYKMNQAGELSFANVVTFNMDEYLGLPHEHDQSYWYFMHDNFFNHLVDMKPENINILNGMTSARATRRRSLPTAASTSSWAASALTATSPSTSPSQASLHAQA